MSANQGKQDFCYHKRKQKPDVKIETLSDEELFDASDKLIKKKSGRIQETDKMIFFTAEQVLKIHSDLIQKTGESEGLAAIWLLLYRTDFPCLSHLEQISPQL